jgi:hypothetical protein
MLSVGGPSNSSDRPPRPARHRPEFTPVAGRFSFFSTNLDSDGISIYVISHI